MSNHFLLLHSPSGSYLYNHCCSLHSFLQKNPVSDVCKLRWYTESYYTELITRNRIFFTDLVSIFFTLQVKVSVHNSATRAHLYVCWLSAAWKLLDYSESVKSRLHRTDWIKTEPLAIFFRTLSSPVELEFHGTVTDTDTDILADFRDPRAEVRVSGEFPVQLATSRTRTTILADLSADLSDTLAFAREDVR